MILTIKNLRSRLKPFRKWGLLLIGLAFLGWWFCLPDPLFDEPVSTVVESREGYLLGARIAEDQQWRFPGSDSLPHRFKKSLLLFEDQYFYLHPGVNPVSTAKALWHNLWNTNRIGGSTLSQQLIRLSRKNPKRTYLEKTLEAMMAFRVELRYNKEEILKLYAENAPYGGNVVGLQAASWRYFGTSAENLSWGQSAALAVLPNAPSLVYPGRSEARFRAKRNRLLDKLYNQGIIDKITHDLALEEPLPGRPMELPDHAHHLVEKIRKGNPAEKVKSTLEFRLQESVNRIARAHLKKLQANNINNIGILVLDVQNKDVLAYLGNYTVGKVHQPYVDIIQSRRSTGSILKPFLFAAALQDGQILPRSLLPDIPTRVNGYTPENFDRNFNGAVPAEIALTRSLNVPAVRLLQTYGLERFHHLLKKMEAKSIDKQAGHYGLPLILGGAESNLWEITNMYAGMARVVNTYTDQSSQYPTGTFQAPYYTLENDATESKLSFQPEALEAGPAYLTLEALKTVNRPLSEINWEYFRESKPIAWKTGTSYGFKDAWAVGVTPKYAIGIWVGNADGEGRPGLTGIQAAAPILFDVLGELPESSWFNTPYDDLIEVEVCAQSGQLSSPICKITKSQWIPPKGRFSNTCQYHKRVNLNQTRDYQVSSNCYPLEQIQQESWFILPALMSHYYSKQHPEYQPLPPWSENCMEELRPIMEFINPRDNTTQLLPKTFGGESGPVVLQLAHIRPETKVFWYLDNLYLGSTSLQHELEIKPRPGSYILTAVDTEGNRIIQEVAFEYARQGIP